MDHDGNERPVFEIEEGTNGLDASLAPRSPFPEAQGGSLVLAVIGAAIGALVGGFVWFAVEHFLSFQIGYIAILIGALAGWGAVLLGRRGGMTIGFIAAVAGAAGVFAGSYGAYYAAINSEEVRGEWRKGFVELLGQFDGMDAAERAAAVADIEDPDAKAILTELFDGAPADLSALDAGKREKAFDAFCDLIIASADLSYMGFLKQDMKYTGFMVLFGLFGVAYGFKVGASGKLSGKADA